MLARVRPVFLSGVGVSSVTFFVGDSAAQPALTVRTLEPSLYSYLPLMTLVSEVTLVATEVADGLGVVVDNMSTLTAPATEEWWGLSHKRLRALVSALWCVASAVVVEVSIRGGRGEKVSLSFPFFI